MQCDHMVFPMPKYDRNIFSDFLQALQEFMQLCQEKDTEAVKSVLPFWPRVYSKIYMVR